MEIANQNRSVISIPKKIYPALGLLLEAIEYAEQTCSDVWEFAVELDRLNAIGLTLNDFRWLVRSGLVEHQRDITLETDDGRTFRANGDLSFPNGTCFVLTDYGISVARCSSRNALGGNKLLTSKVEYHNGNGAANKEIRLPSSNGTTPFELNRPVWNSERRILKMNGTEVKHFKWCAENQEAILAAFEEEGWPPRIDDPLPPQAEQDSKRRLSDTIKCLNRKQNHPMIRFRGDGTGEGIVWEFVEYHKGDDGIS